MSWRYLNPGLVSLLDNNCTATQYTGYEYSNTGYAFTRGGDGYHRGVTLPQFQEGDDFWAKLDLYIPNAVDSIFLYIPNTYRYHFVLNFSWSQYSRLQFGYGTSTGDYITFAEGSDSLLGVQRGAVNSFVLHAVYGDASTAKTEILFAGKRYTLTGYEVPFMTDTLNKRVAFHGGATTSDIKISNIIFSNEKINPAEHVAVSLPASATETTMATMTGGMYIANSIGQTFLQTPDVSSLITAHGANSTVTSIQVSGNPAYRTSEELANMISLSKSGNTITEHSTIAIGTTSSAFIVDGWGLSGVTLGDLQNMQFGWKAAR